MSHTGKTNRENAEFDAAHDLRLGSVVSALLAIDDTLREIRDRLPEPDGGEPR